MPNYKDLIENLDKKSPEAIIAQVQEIKFDQLETDFSDTTPFQAEVWKAIQAIPCGQTRSYSQLATSIKKPKAIRAVASAVAKNTQFYLIPCHRVIRSDGQIGQFRWGTQLKQELLKHEMTAAKARLMA
jgi:O-6-methylguanine DNA methyltransferase